MQKNQAIFILGSPGSGKDVVIRDICSKFDIVEFASSQIDEMLSEDAAFKRAKTEKQDSLLERKSILITANPYDLSFVSTKGILESVGYNTFLIFVEADLETSYERLNTRNNLKESLEKINIGNINKPSIIQLFPEFVVVENSKTLDLTQSKTFVLNILDDLSFSTDLTIDEITKPKTLKLKLKSVVPGPAAVVIPILAHYEQEKVKKKKKSNFPGNTTDATGEQITGWTSHAESMDEPFPYYSPITSGGRLNKVSTPNSTTDMRSDQDKAETKQRFKTVLNKLKNFKKVVPNGI